MLARHALDIAVMISSLIVSLRFTFVDIFKISSLSSYVMHWSAELKTKVYDPKEGRSERVNLLAHLTPILQFCKIVVKIAMFGGFCLS